VSNAYDVIVIGGGPSGIVSAITAKTTNPDKTVLLVRQEKQAIIPCGIPYIFGALGSSDKDVVPDTGLNNAGVTIKIGSVASIDAEHKTCAMADGEKNSFDKLVFATGSTPSIPAWLKGSGLENVFVVPKDKDYLDGFMQKLGQFKKIVVVGGGFIGVEASDELKKAGKDVTLVEILPHCLALAFDEEFSAMAEEALKSRGVAIKCGLGVKELHGDKKVQKVLLSDGSSIDADAVVLSMGYQPNTSLASKAGLEITPFGFIRVDEYMRTSNPSIFAVGDCAEKRDFATRKPSKIMLASVASAEARVAGMNLYKLSIVKTFSGTISIFSTAIGESAFGSAGLIERDAQKEGFDTITGTFEGPDKHPGSLPGMHKQKIKLIFARDSGILLGADVAGGPSVGELTNVIGFAIQNKATINSLLTAQIGTHPLLTAPPTAYPLIKAAEAAEAALRKARVS
jgi:NADH oxidase (H2O2-forming)